MELIVRFPRLAAWVITCALVAALTAEALVAVRLTQPAMPAMPEQTEHAHGVIVAMRASGAFALRVAGRRGVLWLRPATGTCISRAHLQRHMREHAATDVVYSVRPHGVLIAWSAD